MREDGLRGSPFYGVRRENAHIRSTSGGLRIAAGCLLGRCRAPDRWRGRGGDGIQRPRARLAPIGNAEHDDGVLLVALADGVGKPDARCAAVLLSIGEDDEPVDLVLGLAGQQIVAVRVASSRAVLPLAE